MLGYQLATLLAAAASLAGVEATPTHKHGSCGHKKFWWPVKQTCLPYGGVKHPHPAPPRHHCGAAFHLNPRSSIQNALPLLQDNAVPQRGGGNPRHALACWWATNSSAFPSQRVVVPLRLVLARRYCAPREPAYGAPVCAEKYTWDGAVFYCKRGY
ncbi:hypothetical protein RhiXN_09372 [Rhizoctonia solani]|uniref:Uncharacterized protein n=1 Tax=Rhizoctonia solani TaxID=456999 RepID=A0A8H8SXC2_9AGAM|nr:uncharacterized protein RhiXN_09372 [Rhizoctonia solani]QRW20397.1 hypothetical protein RhiXN_09372 [Rhizoctonia solani]